MFLDFTMLFIYDNKILPCVKNNKQLQPNVEKEQ